MSTVESWIRFLGGQKNNNEDTNDVNAVDDSTSEQVSDRPDDLPLRTDPRPNILPEMNRHKKSLFLEIANKIPPYVIKQYGLLLRTESLEEVVDDDFIKEYIVNILCSITTPKGETAFYPETDLERELIVLIRDAWIIYTLNHKNQYVTYEYNHYSEVPIDEIVNSLLNDAKNKMLKESFEIAAFAHALKVELIEIVNQELSQTKYQSKDVYAQKVNELIISVNANFNFLEYLRQKTNFEMDSFYGDALFTGYSSFLAHVADLNNVAIADLLDVTQPFSLKKHLGERKVLPRLEDFLIEFFQDGNGFYGLENDRDLQQYFNEMTANEGVYRSAIINVLLLLLDFKSEQNQIISLIEIYKGETYPEKEFEKEITARIIAPQLLKHLLKDTALLKGAPNGSDLLSLMTPLYENHGFTDLYSFLRNRRLIRKLKRQKSDITAFRQDLQEIYQDTNPAQIYAAFTKMVEKFPFLKDLIKLETLLVLPPSNFLKLLQHTVNTLNKAIYQIDISRFLLTKKSDFKNEVWNITTYLDKNDANFDESAFELLHSILINAPIDDGRFERFITSARTENRIKQMLSLSAHLPVGRFTHDTDEQEKTRNFNIAIDEFKKMVRTYRKKFKKIEVKKKMPDRVAHYTS